MATALTVGIGDDRVGVAERRSRGVDAMQEGPQRHFKSIDAGVTELQRQRLSSPSLSNFGGDDEGNTLNELGLGFVVAVGFYRRP